MNAKKCDRCGKFYCRQEGKNYVVFAKGGKFGLGCSSISISTNDGYLDGDYSRYKRLYSENVVFDLCEDCAKELWNFLGAKIKRTKEKELSGDVIKECTLSEIKMGDKLKCIDCGEVIELTKKTMIFDEEAEYIICPNCGSKRDIQHYHIRGEKVDE